MINRTSTLRRLLAEEHFIDMPVAYDPLGGRLIESLGFKTVYNGGFVTGGSRCTSEPLLTMDEQVHTAGDIAKAVNVPVVADAGADMGMIFPRTPEELQQATKLAKVPLVYVRSLGNRDNRPTPSSKQLAEMGYKACIDALLYLLVSFHHAKRALMELKQNGEYGGLTQEDCVAARHEIETLVGLDRFYEVEEQTVEDKKWGDR